MSEALAIQVLCLYSCACAPVSWVLWTLSMCCSKALLKE